MINKFDISVSIIYILAVTEFAQSGAIQLVDHNWAKMKPEARLALIRRFAEITPESYSILGKFEDEHYNYFANVGNTDALPLTIHGHLLMAVTPDGFSPAQIIQVLEDAMNSFQG